MFTHCNRLSIGPRHSHTRNPEPSNFTCEDCGEQLPPRSNYEIEHHGVPARCWSCEQATDNNDPTFDPLEAEPP